MILHYIERAVTMADFFGNSVHAFVTIGLLAGTLIVFAVYVVRTRQTIEKLKKRSQRKARDFERQARALEEQTLNARSATEAKSDFLSRMSHEIRTPLNAIIGMTQVAQSSDSIVQIKDHLSNVELNSKHLLRIVSNILDFSKLESGKMRLEESLFSLRGCVEFVANMFRERAEAKNLNLVIDIKGIEHDGLITDSLRLSQVLINLLSNAVKFTDNGVIKVSVEELYYSGNEGVYQFSVSDTGIGIDHTQASRLFTSFTQASADTSRLFGGTGLGLAISKDLVTLLGGDIELETRLGAGSIFTFTIRVRAQISAESAAPPQPALPKQLNLHGKHIMVVDDIDINCEIVVALLEGTGADIKSAGDGKQAFDLFAGSPIGHYDLILMDVLMPVLNGYDATRAIRGLERPDAKSVIIAAVSANALPEDIAHGEQAGMNGYLSKPIDADSLYTKIGEWLEKTAG